MAAPEGADLINARTSQRLAAAAALLGAGALSACSTPSVGSAQAPASLGPNSPVAQDVARAARHPGPYPRFADIPAIPTDVRPASSWRAAVKDVQLRQATLQGQVQALPPLEPETTEAYAAATRGRLGQPPGQVPPEDARAQTEAEAQALRERATPPPPPQ
jgi:hypothetical protein